jgi:hypothetical protein
LLPTEFDPRAIVNRFDDVFGNRSDRFISTARPV